MKVNDIEVKFIKKEGSPSSLEPLSGEILYQIQHSFRERIAEALERAIQRKQDYFELAGIDNRYLDFPIAGAAKIGAQEILKVAKNKNNSLREIDLFIANNVEFDTYVKVFEGYIQHVQKNLGAEPFKTTDVIIELSEGVVVIERSNPPYGWALPGGFIDPGEEPQPAAIREAKEETNLDLENVRKFKVYNNKYRDPRFETSSTVFIAKGVGDAQFGDDAKGLKVIAYEDLLQQEYAFDHYEILEDYVSKYHAQ